MKRNLLISLFILTAGCSSPAPVEKSAPAPAPVKVDPYPGKAVCFLLIDAQTGQIQKSVNEENCNIQLPACSTFKVPLAVMGFDSGILKNESTKFKWNKQKHSIEAWNQDQTAASWMKNSTVWYSQVLTGKMGFQKLQNYLRKFDYGNQDLSGGIKTAWLTPASFINEEKGFSLKISAFQQTDFLKKLLYDKLPATKKSQDLTKKIILLETTPAGNKFSGKTGSGYTDTTLKRRIGWFVGTLTTKDHQYVFATNFTDTVDVENGEYGSRYAKELAIEQLKEEGLW